MVFMTELVIEEKNFTEEEIDKLWGQIINKLPDNVQKEAREKGFHLNLYEEDQIAKYYKIKIPNATKQLEQQIENISPYVICLRN